MAEQFSLKNLPVPLLPLFLCKKQTNKQNPTTTKTTVVEQKREAIKQQKKYHTIPCNRKDRYHKVQLS